jgi:hypothetical protein
LALRQFVAGVQSVAGVHDYKMCGHLPRAPRRGAAPSQGDGGILMKRALEMLLFESVKLKSYEEDYFLTEKGPYTTTASALPSLPPPLPLARLYKSVTRS